MSPSPKDNGTKYLMYMHAGSGNHGCEAIVRSLAMGLDSRCAVLSNHPEEDSRYGLDEICDILPVRHYEQNPVQKTIFWAARHLTRREDLQMGYAYRGAEPFADYDMALSIGGDNYCYEDALVNLRGANRLFEKHGIPTALVGCSVEEDILKRPDMIEDLKRYKYIIARESVTYRMLRDALSGRSDDVFLAPDPAFALKPEECPLPEGFREGHTTGINISPMIMNYASGGDTELVFRNYCRMIETILSETHDTIALIPHVVTPVSDDTVPVRRLYDAYADSGRMIIVPDAPAAQLKYLISRCRLLITARTHASIAAYSTYVPTLVVGYSVKAAGIADDLFGSHEGYVCAVQDLHTDNDLTDAYMELEAHADTQRDILKERVPEWISRCKSVAGILKNGS